MSPPSGEERTRVEHKDQRKQTKPEKHPCGVPWWACTLVSYEGEKQGGADIKKADEGQKKESRLAVSGGEERSTENKEEK